jgi:uncharacterized protein YecE (DUF72 family)
MDGSQQLGLWAAIPEHKSLPPDAAPLSPLIRFGTSTWTYEGWQGLVYTKRYLPSRFKSDCLAEYARYEYNGERLFRTVGFDFTFYGPPTLRQLAHYASQVPADFVACSKVWEEITVPAHTRHPRNGPAMGPNPHFLDAGYFVEQVLAPYAAVFRPHTGPFIFEFQRALGMEPGAFVERLDKFLARLPTSWEYAVEVRHESLLTKEYHAILKEHGVAHVYNHWTHMPRLSEQHRMFAGTFTAPFVVLRLLTPRGVKYEDAVKRYKPYDKIVQALPDMRADTVDLAEQAMKEEKRAYVLVNNRSEGSAPRTIQAIREIMTGRRVAEPARRVKDPREEGR